MAGLRSDRAGLIGTRPFRALHHSNSDAALIGGGTVSRPGEVSLGHDAALVQDELPEFHRHVLDVLRQPLEDGEHCHNQIKPAPAHFPSQGCSLCVGPAGPQHGIPPPMYLIKFYESFHP